MKIELDGKYVTRGGGTPVRIITVESGIPGFPVIGVHDDDVCTWTIEGVFNPERQPARMDLIPAEDYDPTPYCSACGARFKADCDCGPIARNE